MRKRIDMQKRLLACGLLIAALLCGRASADENLVQNGKPDTLPSRTEVPRDKQQDDSGAHKFFLDEGSSALPGWTVTRAQIIIYDWSGSPGNYGGIETGMHPHLIDLHGAGGIQQELTTVPGQQYQVKFIAGSQNPDTLQVRFGDQTTNDHVVVWQAQSFNHVFTAASDKTVLGLTSMDTSHYGPYLIEISVTPYNAAAAAIRPDIERQYRIATDGFESGEMDKVAGVLTDDFTFHPKEGDTQDRATYLKALQDEKSHRGILNCSINHVEPGEDHAEVLADLTLYWNDPGLNNQRMLVQSRVTDVWVKQGDTWKLQSRTEQGVARSPSRR